jgi:hypothetical protein
MNTTQASTAENRGPYAPEHGPILFLSICPECKHERVQKYNRNAITRLLHNGHPVEGYCIRCNEYWRISALERAELAAEIAD